VPSLATGSWDSDPHQVCARHQATYRRGGGYRLAAVSVPSRCADDVAADGDGDRAVVGAALGVVVLGETVHTDDTGLMVLAAVVLVMAVATAALAGNEAVATQSPAVASAQDAVRQPALRPTWRRSVSAGRPRAIAANIERASTRLRRRGDDVCRNRIFVELLVNGFV
jgi:hypothetical protein